MFCEKCGSSMSEGAAFCPQCGNPVKSAVQSSENASIPGMIPVSQLPLGNGQTAQAGQGNVGKPKSDISWKPIAAIGGGVLALVVVIVLIVVLVINLGDDGGSSSRRNRDTEEYSSRAGRDKEVVSENKELILGDWVSHRDSTMGSEFAVRFLEETIKEFKKYDPDWAEYLEEYFSNLPTKELMEALEFDEPGEIALVFDEDGGLDIKLYDEWASDEFGSFSYKFVDKNTIRLTCRIEKDYYRDQMVVTFSYEAEYEVDEDNLTLDLFGNTVTFDRD